MFLIYLCFAFYFVSINFSSFYIFNITIVYPRWRKLAACAQFKIQNSLCRPHSHQSHYSHCSHYSPIQNSEFKIQNSCSLCPIHNSKFSPRPICPICPICPTRPTSRIIACVAHTPRWCELVACAQFTIRHSLPVPFVPFVPHSMLISKF